MPGRLRALLALAGGRFAFAWSSYAFLFLPWTLAVAALEAPTGYTLLQSVGVGAISVTACLVVGFVFSLTLLRTRATRTVRPAVLVAYWVAGGLALGLSRALCAAAWTDADPEFALRLIGSVAGAVVWIPATAVVQALLEVRRERYDELEAVERRIVRIRESAESSLEEQIAALSSAVRTAVEPHIQKLSERVASLNSSMTRNMLKSLANDIQKVSGDVVRLTSHRVAEQGGIEGTAPDRRPRIFTGVALDVIKRPIMWPWVGSTMIVLGTAPEIYRTAGAGTVVIGIEAIIVATGVLTLVEQFSATLSDRAATWLQWGTLLVIAAGVGITPPLAEGIGPDFKVDTQLTPIFLFAPLVALATVMTSIAVATRRQSIVLMDELQRQNDKLQLVAHGLHLQADDVRRRVASLLHGPVQGRLSAASMLLGLHLGHQSGRSVAQVIEETAVLIKAASDDLTELSIVPEDRQSAHDVLTQLELDWQGIVEVTWTVDPEATDQLDRDAARAATVNELLVDMVTNAARHGRARSAQLSLHVRPSTQRGEPSLLEVRCTNDGTLAPAVPRESGLVGALLRSMGGKWTVFQDGPAVVSLATLPL